MTSHLLESLAHKVLSSTLRKSPIVGDFHKLDLFPLFAFPTRPWIAQKTQEPRAWCEEENSAVGKRRRSTCVESLLCARPTHLGTSTYIHCMFPPKLLQRYSHPHFAGEKNRSQVWWFAQNGGAKIQTKTDLVSNSGRRALCFEAAAPSETLSQPLPLQHPTGNSLAFREWCPCSLANNFISPSVFIIYFLLLCFTLMRPGKWTRQMGKEVEILCNRLYHKTCLKCQPQGFAGVGATEVGLKVRLNWTSNPRGNTWKRLLKKAFPAECLAAEAGAGSAQTSS